MLITLVCLLSCTTDVNIMKTHDDLVDSSVIVDSAEAQDTNTQTSDLTIGLSEIHFRQIACPQCVGEPGEFDIRAELLLYHPTSGDYLEYLTPVGTCTTALHDTHVSSQPLLSTAIASFNDIQLSPTGNGHWWNPAIYEHQYQRNSLYSISTEHGIIENAFQTIEGFDEINPYTLLWVDPSYAFETVISKSGTTFSWAPTLPNTQFEIIVAVYSPDGSQFLGAVSCMDNDTGMMTIPGSYVAAYPYWSLAAVHFIRHKTDRAAAADFNGYIQSHMQWEVVGTGHVE